MRSVPTAVTQGADGNFYVGELTGQPFPRGAAWVYRVPSGGGTPVVVAEGFTNIIDIAFGPNGAGYVLEHDVDVIIPPLGPSNDGRLIRINPNGTQTVIATPGMIKTGGITVGPDGALYVTNRSIFAGSGEVLRIVP
jgi:sugar lactone lactonase YvrE